MPAEAPSEQEEQLDEQPEENKSASSKVLEQAGSALGKAADFAGKMLGGITVYAEESPEGESEQPESAPPPADDKNNAALEGLVKVMKPVAVCGIITGALAVSVAHPTTTPLMAVGAKVAVDAVLSFEVNKPNHDANTDGAEVEQLPATEEAGEQATVPEELEEDSNAHLLKEMPDGLPLPNVPRKPNWWEIGWRRLLGRSVNDTIWDRWYPPEASNYVGQVRTCSEPAGLGEVNDEELNRLDWELEKGFNEALQSEKDFTDGVRVGFLKNMTKLPFNLAGFVLNSREVQDMPEKLESSDVEDEGAYVGGKITADVVTTVLGIIGIVSGVGQMVTGLAGDVGGGALCASGVGIPAGVAVVAGSTTLVVAGAAEVAASASLVYSSVSNLGRDVDELNKSKEKVNPEDSMVDENALEQHIEKFWEEPVECNGTKVYKRTDLIDPNLVDKQGMTNLQRMQLGKAPKGPDGKSMELHHMIQSDNSAIAEVTRTFHQRNKRVIHINPSTTPSGINRAEFNKWRTAYWKLRAKDFM